MILQKEDSDRRVQEGGSTREAGKIRERVSDLKSGWMKIEQQTDRHC